jgi:hypothetical protein
MEEQSGRAKRDRLEGLRRVRKVLRVATRGQEIFSRPVPDRVNFYEKVKTESRETSAYGRTRNKNNFFELTSLGKVI